MMTWRSKRTDPIYTIAVERKLNVFEIERMLDSTRRFEVHVGSGL